MLFYYKFGSIYVIMMPVTSNDVGVWTGKEVISGTVQSNSLQNKF